MSTPFLIRIVLLAAMLSSMAACGDRSAQDPSSGEPPVGEIRTITTEQEIRLPADDYVLSGQQRLLLVSAQHELVARCLARFGMTYTEPDQPPSAYLSFNNDRRFGLFNADDAARYGFHPPPEPDQAQYALVEAWRPSDAERSVLSGDGAGDLRDSSGRGVPADGCYGEGARGVAIESDVNEPTAEIHDLYLSSIDDSRTRRAFDDWSACMAQHQLDYADPPALFEVPWSKAVSGLEKRVARIHVECAVSTNMVGTWVSVLAAYQQREIAAHRDYFDELKSVNEQLVNKAEDILSAAG